MNPHLPKTSDFFRQCSECGKSEDEQPACECQIEKTRNPLENPYERDKYGNYLEFYRRYLEYIYVLFRSWWNDTSGEIEIDSLGIVEGISDQWKQRRYTYEEFMQEVLGLVDEYRTTGILEIDGEILVKDDIQIPQKESGILASFIMSVAKKHHEEELELGAGKPRIYKKE